MTPNILGRQKLEKQNRPAISGNKQGRKFSSDPFFTATKLRPLTLSVAKHFNIRISEGSGRNDGEVSDAIPSEQNLAEGFNQPETLSFFSHFFICTSQEFA